MSENQKVPPKGGGPVKDESAEANFKLITTTSGMRVSQACDRCRIKKIKCDGKRPCHNCAKINFECKTSDKLTRRAFPKGYTENLERKLKELEEENKSLKDKLGHSLEEPEQSNHSKEVSQDVHSADAIKQDFAYVGNATQDSKLHTPVNVVHSNLAIDQIFNLNNQGVIIGNDNLNFESQFNHLLINLNMPFLKISNSHNYLLNDPNFYLYHPSCSTYNVIQNRDHEIVYNPLTANDALHDDELGALSNISNRAFPSDIYDLFIKLVNNFKKVFKSKKDLDNQVSQFFLNYNTFIPIFDYKLFIASYDAFHTMYPFLFTYDDATINGFNMLNNDYHIVNQYLPVVVQVYAMAMMNDPTMNLNLLLNHHNPHYILEEGMKEISSADFLVRSLYDFLPYFNVFHVSISQLQTYMLFLYYSLITNNKEKSLILSSLVNSFIGILGINLNSKNLFFNDLALNIHQKRDRVKLFWSFKALLKCFNLKFGFKPSINTTVINPVTIDRYFELTPEKLSHLLDSQNGQIDELFTTLLRPSVEFLNLMNIIIPSSFSPNYYRYLKNGRGLGHQNHHRKHHPHHLDWILNDDDGDGNDGNLNYNFTQFLAIDKNLSNWRYSLKDKYLDLLTLKSEMNLPVISNITTNNLYLKLSAKEISGISGITAEGILNYMNTGLPDVYTASQLIKIQLNFHCLLIRSMNYLNFVIDRELTSAYYTKIANISSEFLAYFILIFEHVGQSVETWETAGPASKSNVNSVVLNSLGLDVDDEGFIINDFSVKRRKVGSRPHNNMRRKLRRVPRSLFNFMLNGLSLTIISIKKSVLLQMLYLLICNLRNFKKGFTIPSDIVQLLNKSINLFAIIFINYEDTSAAGNKQRKTKEDEIFRKLMNDEFKEEMMNEPANDSDYEDDGETGFDANYSSIDWDDENLDEDLKYLKILKFIRYKVDMILAVTQSQGIITNGDHTLSIRPNENDQESDFQLRNHPVDNDYKTPQVERESIPPQVSGTSQIPKFDFLLDDQYASTAASLAPELYNIEKYKPTNANNNLLNKEKLAINDLVNLKRRDNKHDGMMSPPWNFSQVSTSTQNEKSTL